MTRRIPWEVAPNGFLSWTVRCQGMLLHHEPFQFLAVRWAAKQCRQDWEQQRIRSELTIKGRDGKIKDKRTYGGDPERTPG